VVGEFIGCPLDKKKTATTDGLYNVEKQKAETLAEDVSVGIRSYFID
jgi:hypothetical protein